MLHTTQVQQRDACLQRAAAPVRPRAASAPRQAGSRSKHAAHAAAQLETAVDAEPAAAPGRKPGDAYASARSLRQLVARLDRVPPGREAPHDAAHSAAVALEAFARLLFKCHACSADAAAVFASLDGRRRVHALCVDISRAYQKHKAGDWDLADVSVLNTALRALATLVSLQVGDSPVISRTDAKVFVRSCCPCFVQSPPRVCSCCSSCCSRKTMSARTV